MDNICGFQPSSNYFNGLYNQLYDVNLEPTHDANPPEMVAIANEAVHGIAQEAYYTDEMLVLVRQIVACIPGNNTDLDVNKIRPEELITKLKERLETFFSTQIDPYNPKGWFLTRWEGFLSALRAVDSCSKLMQISHGCKDMNHFADLQNNVLGIIQRISSNNFITAYYKERGINNLKFLFDDLILLQKILDFNNASSFSLIEEKRQEIDKKLNDFQPYILKIIRDESSGFPSFLKQQGRWAPQDYELMCEFLESSVGRKDDIVAKFRFRLLCTLIYTTPTLFNLNCEYRGLDKAERSFSLDPADFTATTRSSLVYVLNELSTIKLPSEDPYAFRNTFRRRNFYDDGFLPLLEHFNKIMDASTFEVRKICHPFKVNILTNLCERYENFQWTFPLQSPCLLSVAKICWLCISEMAEINDKGRQNDIEPLLVRILDKTIHVMWYSKIEEEEQNKIWASEVKYLLLPELEPLLGICKNLLDLNSVVLNNVSTKSINFEDCPQFNNLVANSICSRESVWSDKGIALIQNINHPDIQRLVMEYGNYKRAFDKLGVADRSITIHGKIIPYHSSMVPDYLIEEIQKDKSISSKDFKAILYGFYCGYDEDSSLFKHWKKDWVQAVTTLHPEVAEEPAAFFKHHFSEEFDEQCKVFFQTIARDYGPTDMSLAVEGKLIPVHQEVLKSCANLLAPNYFSGLFSGSFKRQEVIDLDHPGSQLIAGKIRVFNDEPAYMPITHRGVSLQLMDIYREETDFPHCATFRDEQRCVRDIFFPVSDPFILAQKFNDESYTDQLLELRFQYFLKTKLTNNLSVLAQAIADFYVKNSGCDLVHMCEEAFKVANEKRIRILGNVENLMDLIQQKTYGTSDFRIDLWSYSDEEIILYFRYMAEHIEEGEFFRHFYGTMPREVFSLGEKGRAIFRKKAFNFMKTNLTSINEMSYFEFNNSLIGLIRLLSFAEIIKLTTEEVSIVTEMVNALPGKLPLIMLDSDYNINLKNQVVKQWGELNQKLGTQIPFVIDFGQ